jgi:subtilisin family serine protease
MAKKRASARPRAAVRPHPAGAGADAAAAEPEVTNDPPAPALAPAAANVKPADQYLYLNGETIPLKKSETDFIVQTMDALPRHKSTGAAALGLKSMAGEEGGLPQMLEKRLSTEVALFHAPDSASRDAAMEEIRHEAVAHHVYQRADTGETLRFNDRLYLRLHQEDHATLNRLLDEYHLDYVDALGGSHVLQVTDASLANGLKVAERMMKDPAVASCHPEILRSLGRQDDTAPVPGRMPFFEKQWYLEDGLLNHASLSRGASIDIQGAWALSTGREDIVVAVIDDGFDLGHPAFSHVRIHPQARNFRPNEKPDNVLATDKDVHGTPVMGIISASATSGIMQGIAPACTLLPICIEFGSISLSEMIHIFRYASTHADVINCSFGFSPSSLPLEPAVREELEKLARTGGRRGKGAVFVFSAGNHDAPTSLDATQNINGIVYYSYSERRLVTLPPKVPIYAGYPSVAGSITVASMSSLRRKSGYSNWGPDICVAAPSNNWHGVSFTRMPQDRELKQKFLTTSFRGLGQLTTRNRSTHGGRFEPQHQTLEPDILEDGYTVHFGGTSGAAPLVSGVVALMLSVNPELTSAEVRDILMTTASQDVDVTLEPPHDPNLQGRPVGFTQGRSLTFGAGRLSAKAAVETAARRSVALSPALASGSSEDLVAMTRRLETLEALVLAMQTQQSQTLARIEAILQTDITVPSA